MIPGDGLGHACGSNSIKTGAVAAGQYSYSAESSLALGHGINLYCYTQALFLSPSFSGRLFMALYFSKFLPTPCCFVGWSFGEL